MTTWAQALRDKNRDRGKLPFPHQAAFLIDNPIRRALAKPSRIIDNLELHGSEHVLELGPGPGVFSVELARRLQGRLDLFDVQPAMLEKARRKLAGAGFHDVGITCGEAGDELPYPEHTFDLAFLASVIGEVPDKQACIATLNRVIRPGGRLVFVEMFPDPDRLSVAELRALAESRNFALVHAVGNRWHDIATFRALGSR